jgi:hypothetical protein
MSLLVVGHLIATASACRHHSAIVERGDQFSLQHEKDVPLTTPVISHIPSAVLDPSDPDKPESHGAPESFALLSSVPRR